jgi:hypothetical protein
MMFTHCSSAGAVVGRTFQVYSVKIAEIKGIQWPLKVYGVVAARDDVDKHRNPLFLRSRDNYQIVHQKVLQAHSFYFDSFPFVLPQYGISD